MFIPVNVLWGVAGFVFVATVRTVYKLLKDVDHAHIKIRQLERELVKAKILPNELSK